jgi:hypothetical protein
MNKTYVFQHYNTAGNAKTCVFRAKRSTLTLALFFDTPCFENPIEPIVISLLAC